MRGFSGEKGQDRNCIQFFESDSLKKTEGHRDISGWIGRILQCAVFRETHFATRYKSMTTKRQGAYGKSVFQITVHFSTLVSTGQIQEIWPYFTKTLITLYRQHTLRTYSCQTSFERALSGTPLQHPAYFLANSNFSSLSCGADFGFPETEINTWSWFSWIEVSEPTRCVPQHKGKIHFSIILLVIHSKGLLAYLYKWG